MPEEKDYKQMMGDYDIVDEVHEGIRPLPKSPEELGYPADFNPYQAQKKRIQRAAKSISKCQVYIAEMGAIYKQFGDEGRSAVCMLLHTMMQESKDALVEFYVEKM